MSWSEYVKEHGQEEYDAMDRYREAMVAKGHSADCAEVVYGGTCDCGKGQDDHC